MTPQPDSYVSRHDKPLPAAKCEFPRASGYYLTVALRVNVQKQLAKTLATVGNIRLF
jgi:hypothetical protein